MANKPEDVEHIYKYTLIEIDEKTDKFKKTKGYASLHEDAVGSLEEVADYIVNLNNLFENREVVVNFRKPSDRPDVLVYIDSEGQHIDFSEDLSKSEIRKLKQLVEAKYKRIHCDKKGKKKILDE